MSPSSMDARMDFQAMGSHRSRDFISKEFSWIQISKVEKKKKLNETSKTRRVLSDLSKKDSERKKKISISCAYTFQE